jgi:hypothetical protein
MLLHPVLWSQLRIPSSRCRVDYMFSHSIINERKGHSNFQLIIITHDENFLRKLGQSDVMEFYWCELKRF